MPYHQDGDRLTASLIRDFNLCAVRKIEHLARDARHIELDLTRAKFVDSEGLILLYRLLRDGKTVVLRHPPPLFAEAAHILGLDEHFAALQIEPRPLTR